MLWRLGHYLLIGAALFAGNLFWEARRPQPSAAPLEISVLQQVGIRGQFMIRTGREPTPAELDFEIERAIDEEVLFREALALGIEQTDTVVRQRLARNLRFVDGNSDVSDDDLVREAFSLGLERSDPVVRRRLVQRMKLGVAGSVRRESIPEDELRAVYAEQSERFMSPARVSLAHVFLSRDRRTTSLPVAARIVSERLRAQPLAVSEAIVLGDPFLQGHEFASLSESDLAKVFGPEFAREVFALPEGAWSAPLESAYGLHVVRIDASAPEAPVSFELVQKKISEELYAEREREAVAELLWELRGRYTIVRQEQ